MIINLSSEMTIINQNLSHEKAHFPEHLVVHSTP